MKIEKLIEQLRTESLYADKASLEIMDLCMEAAQTLESLQSDLEKVKAERDAALHDMRRVGMSDDFCTFCAYCCINGEPVYRPEEEYLAHCEKCDENYSQFEWRGPQKGV